jgi:hypothetical protein
MWGRCFMGATSSPYQTEQVMGRDEELILGDTTYYHNVFIWERVRVNLPGALDYDPTMSWVSNVREYGRMAAYLFIYVDELRHTIPCVEELWQAGRKMGSICSYLGIQDASRKRRGCSRKPGPWAGQMVCMENLEAGVQVYMSHNKWDNTQQLLPLLKDTWGGPFG